MLNLVSKFEEKHDVQEIKLNMMLKINQPFKNI